MQRVISKAVLKAVKLLHLFLENCRLLFYRFCLHESYFGKNIRINHGVRFSATDGGKLSVGKDVQIDRNATLISKFGLLSIADRTYIGIGTIICSRQSIEIGSDVLIAEYVSIRDQDHDFMNPFDIADYGFICDRISIGDNVWIGARVAVTKGVSIGSNSVIGANSVVTENIPANVLAVGSPAKVIKKIPNAQLKK